jgi:hypothetical protein
MSTACSVNQWMVSGSLPRPRSPAMRAASRGRLDLARGMRADSPCSSPQSGPSPRAAPGGRSLLGIGPAGVPCGRITPAAAEAEGRAPGPARQGAVAGRRAGKHVRGGGEGLGVPAGGRRVPSLVRQDHPDIAQDVRAEAPLVPGGAEEVRGVTRVHLVQVAEVVGRLPYGHPPRQHLGRQRPLGPVAAPDRLDKGVQFLAALDPPGEAPQVAVPPGGPAAEGQAEPDGGGEGGRGEQGGAKVGPSPPSGPGSPRSASARGRWSFWPTTGPDRAVCRSWPWPT